jgi:hypothetical protein
MTEVSFSKSVFESRLVWSNDHASVVFKIGACLTPEGVSFCITTIRFSASG